jgi:hypothetical protein
MEADGMGTMLKKKSRCFPDADDRAWPRLKCDFVADCITSGERWPCRVVDISERGFGIIANVKLHEGDIVDIADPSTKTQVVWAENSRAGLRVLN